MRAKDLHCNPSVLFLGGFPGEITEILIDVLAFLSNGNGPYPSVLDLQKMPAVRAGGFSVVSLPGFSRLWGLLSRFSRF